MTIADRIHTAIRDAGYAIVPRRITESMKCAPSWEDCLDQAPRSLISFDVVKIFEAALVEFGYRIVPVELSRVQHDAISGTGVMWRDSNSADVYRVAVASAPSVVDVMEMG